MTTVWTDRDTGAAAAKRPDRQLPQGIFIGIGSVAVVVAAFIASALPQNDAVLQMGELSWNGRGDMARILTLSVAVIVGRLLGDCYRLYRLFSRAQVERRTPMASHHLLKEKEHHA
jgi:hypothetical protein